ncbi:DNA repair exonuclease SbcCD nuclease subunit [Kineococcus xinjiangensis]|uniref:DNA repair exonuclease SbcCD nuclease subunit n=1 Tax=Kineococcus xinjiangensis TaxID=512762 RepID=A0A2S6ITR9_9ACTN|nr:DNA repair exonuclease [Kineococcus xinjiangensis]PPK97643.1 DNA repair exonuclease SbcCD nuclease subunit [Kineococcus xinjiangensis]
MPADHRDAAPAPAPARPPSAVRIVHAADIHLDSPLRGLARLGDDDLARTLRQASRGALANLVALCEEQGADVLVIAGDLYDGTWHDYATGRFFTEQMRRLADSGIRVFLASGNHDAESQITHSLTLPPNVHLFDVGAAETLVLDDLGLAVHGQGYRTKAVSDNLAADYPERVSGLVNVGVLHAAVDGSAGEHARYAPCSVADLRALGYEYTALGHIHVRQVLLSGEHTVAYSGNLQGRHPRETGPKGAYVVDLEPGAEARASFHALDVARWEALEVDVSGAQDYPEVLERVQAEFTTARAQAGDRPLVVRATLVGTTPAAARLADAERLREEVGQVAALTGVTCERARSRAAAPAALQPVDADLLAAVRRAAAAQVAQPGELTKPLRQLRTEVGLDLAEGELLDLKDPRTLAALAQEAAAELEARLGGLR